jgi:CrcB protein
MAAYLWVAVGGLFGSAARFAVGRMAGERFGWSFPFATLAVNLTGAFAIGLVVTLLAGRLPDAAWRLLLITGFLGGYTTFSSYSLELVTMLIEGRWGPAVLYGLASNLLGLAACWGGVLLGRLLAD